jgi:hypothetical protein
MNTLPANDITPEVLALLSKPGRPDPDARRALCEARVTLNGRPARISGAQLEFAVVRDTVTGLACEWAWETAARIVARGGAFRS